MIAYIKGILTHKTPTEVVVETASGVGYQIFISLYTYAKIQSLREVTLHTYVLIKEDAHLLYGFYEKGEKEMFGYLLSISGVGASTARLMLSSLTPQDIFKTITSGRVDVLERVKGIGKKTAERIVLELKDKLLKVGAPKAYHAEDCVLPVSTDSILSTSIDIQYDAITALTTLGIVRQQAEQAVQKVLHMHAEVKDVETLIKLALQHLSAL